MKRPQITLYMLMLCTPLSLVVPMHALEEAAPAESDGGEPADHDEYDQNKAQQRDQQEAEEEHAHQHSADTQTGELRIDAGPMHHDPKHHVLSEDGSGDAGSHDGDPKDTQRHVDQDENALDQEQHSNSARDTLDRDRFNAHSPAKRVQDALTKLKKAPTGDRAQELSDHITERQEVLRNKKKALRKMLSDMESAASDSPEVKKKLEILRKNVEKQVKQIETAQHLLEAAKNSMGEAYGIRSPEDTLFLEKSALSGDSAISKTSVEDFIKAKMPEIHHRQETYIRDAFKDANARQHLTTDMFSFIRYEATLPEVYRPRDITEAVRNVGEGQSVLTDVLSGKKQLAPHSTLPYEIEAFWKERVKEITKMQWSLYEHALGKDPVGFTSGMMRINDPQNTLYDFMNSVPDNFTIDGKRVNYDRAGSTHYKGLRKSSRGFDPRTDAGDLDVGGLPNGRGHIHYGELPDGQMFIKYEFHGSGMDGPATLGEDIAHVFDFTRTRGLQDLGHKEHVPSMVKDAFDIVTDGAEPPLSKEEKAAIKAEGMKSMREILSSGALSGRFDPHQVDQFNTFVEATGLGEHPEMRKGNEVILDTKNMGKPADAVHSDTARTTVEHPKKPGVLDHIKSFLESLGPRVQAAFTNNPAKKALLLKDISTIQMKYNQLEKAASTHREALKTLRDGTEEIDQALQEERITDVLKIAAEMHDAASAIGSAKYAEEIKRNSFYTVKTYPTRVRDSVM